MSLLDEVALEMTRQDEVHPAGYPASRDGIRLGLAAAEDELNEAHIAWREERCRCPIPGCVHSDWAHTRVELIQAAAVLLRTAREIEATP